MTLRVGTCHFVSRWTAVRYYAAQYGFDAGAEVEKKINSGEIKIGPPPLKPGERYALIDNDTRYAIEEDRAKELRRIAGKPIDAMKAATGKRRRFDEKK